MQSAVTHGIYNPRDYKSGWGDVVADVGKTIGGAVAGLPEAQRMDAQLALEHDEGTKAEDAMRTAFNIWAQEGGQDPAQQKRLLDQMPTWKMGAKIDDFGQRTAAWLNSLKNMPGGAEAIAKATAALKSLQMKKQPDATNAPSSGTQIPADNNAVSSIRASVPMPYGYGGAV